MDAARQRREAIRQALVKIVWLAVDVQADALLCGGDLFEHDRVTPDTIAFVRALFQGIAPLPVLIAPGNHDWLGPHSPYRQARWSANVHVFASNRLMPYPLADGLTLWGAAHCAPAGTRNFLDGFHVDRGGVHLALFHGSEQSWLAAQADEGGAAKEPHAPFHAAQIAAAGLHHALLGHYHRPRDAERFTYPGNPEPLAFGEEGERGAVVVAVAPDGAVTRERRRVATTQSHDLRLDVTGCASAFDVREQVASLLEPYRGLVRLTLHGALAPEVDLRPRELAALAPWLDGVALRLGDLRSAYDFEQIAREPTVRGQFVRDVQAADLDGERRRRVLLAGLRALDGRDDLEVA